NSDTALNTGTTVAALQSVGGLLRGSAMLLETRGFILASNAMAAAMPDQARIDVTVNGGGAQPIVFGASDFVNGLGAITTGEVVAAINRQAQGFTAGLTANNRLMLMSNTYGSGSSIAIAPPPAGPPPPNAVPVLGFAGGDAPVAGTRQI